jgi:hypothetical protein
VAPPAPDPAAGEHSAGQADGGAGQAAETGATPAQVIRLPLSDARKEAEKWW